MVPTDSPLAFAQVIEALEKEVAAIKLRQGEIRAELELLERNATKLHEIRDSLKGLSSLRPVGTSVSAQSTAGGTPASKTSRRRKGRRQTAKGDTTDVVFTEVIQSPGLTSTQVADRLVSKIPHSAAKNKRKLVTGTLGYLLKKERIRKDEIGRWFPA